MLKLNQIYKVKEGHEGKCGEFVGFGGMAKYIKITIVGGIHTYYDILDLGYTKLSKCNCFTEDDLELEEECTYCEGLGFRTISVENENGGGDIEREICPKCNGKSKPEEEVKEKSLEDLEVGDGYQKLTNYLFSRGHSITKPLIDDIWYYLQVETLLEEKLGIKVKIK